MTLIGYVLIDEKRSCKDLAIAAAGQWFNSWAGQIGQLPCPHQGWRIGVVGVKVFLGSRSQSWSRKIMLAKVESRSQTKKMPESQSRIDFTTTRQPWSTCPMYVGFKPTLMWACCCGLDVIIILLNYAIKNVTVMQKAHSNKPI